MIEILLAEEHVQVYDLWRQQQVRDLAIAHIDFHCDMRGLLIDRGRGRAHRIDRGDARMSEVDSGNFLGHAIMNGMVRSVRWIHDQHGGRRHDVGTVKYCGDVTALPHRLLHWLRPSREVKVELADLTFPEWDGVRAGEHLDIDWDGIGSIEYDTDHIRRLMRAVIERDHARPQAIYLVYSPGYSHPDRRLYDEFASMLLERFAPARLQPLPSYQGPPHLAEPSGLIDSLERRVVLGLRRFGVY